jgi:two-component system, LytTR family, sensor kinase
VKARVAAGACVLWALVGFVSGAQSSLAAALQGRTEALGPAITAGLQQSLPWIPATLLAVWMAARLPLTAVTWRRRLLPHLAAVLAAAIVTNALVVATYWAQQGVFRGVGVLARQAVVWGLSRIFVTALLYAATVAVTQAVDYWRALRTRELQLARLETQLERARLQVLNAQIRPHFLFNTLHTIGQLWRSGRSAEADAMLDHLGSLFQKVISSTSRTEVTLGEELAMVRDYLAIEQVRFGDRMTSRLEAGADALSCLVPPLILQPLVENAVKHGVAASMEPAEVSVVAAAVNGRLVVTVSDEGPGMGAPIATAGSGTGLSNVRDRLQTLFGDRQTLEALRRLPRGTEVRLQIPAVREGESG